MLKIHVPRETTRLRLPQGQYTKRFLLKRTSDNLFELFHRILVIMPYNYFLRLTADFLAILQDILPYGHIGADLNCQSKNSPLGSYRY